MKRVVLAALMLTMGAGCALASDCDAIRNRETPYAYISHERQRFGTQGVDMTLMGSVVRSGDGVTDVVETNNAPRRFDTPASWRRGGITFREYDHVPGPGKSLGQTRQIQVTPSDATFDVSHDFDYEQSAVGGRFSRVRTLHAAFQGLGTVTVGGCAFAVHRFDVADGHAQNPVVEHLVYAPELGIFLSRHFESKDQAEDAVITDISTNLMARDIGWPHDLALPFGAGLPFPPTGAVAEALDAKQTPDDCDRLRRSTVSYVAARYEHTNPKYGTAGDYMWFVRVHRLGDGLVEVDDSVGPNAGQSTYRYGLLQKSAGKKTVTEFNYGTLQPKVLLSKADKQFTSMQHVTSGDRAPPDVEVKRNLSFERGDVIRLGRCFFTALRYSFVDTVFSHGRRFEAKDRFVFVPDLGLPIESFAEGADGSASEFDVFSVSTNPMPLPGLADVVDATKK